MSGLEFQPELRLENARRVGRGGASEIAVAQIGDRIVEVHAIEGVERVHAKLGRQAFPNLECLGQREIRLGETGASKYIASQVTVRTGERRGEGSCREQTKQVVGSAPSAAP